MTETASRAVVVLGIFVADATFRTDRLPKMGETLLGRGFALGPGGKGSNQAVAAARAGAPTVMLTRLGRDTFAEMAQGIWAEAGVRPQVIDDPDSYTGAACILVDAETGDNAIIVSTGAAAHISPADIDRWGDTIDGGAVFLTQLEQPVDAAHAALARARKAGCLTILNPAPATDLPADILSLCDYVTPNEAEAEGLTGIPVTSLDAARDAASALITKGAGAVVMTLGERGALLHDGRETILVPAISAGPVVETTGAGDCLNGAFAAALARGLPAADALREGVAAACISVTRAGAAASMPTAAEISAQVARSLPRT